MGRPAVALGFHTHTHTETRHKVGSANLGEAGLSPLIKKPGDLIAKEVLRIAGENGHSSSREMAVLLISRGTRHSTAQDSLVEAQEITNGN